MGDAVPEMFGPYRIEELLGRGGMGVVHRAYDTVHERYVALKRLLSSADQKVQDRFRREAKTAAALNAPHVVPIHAHGEIDGRLYLDMRLIDGSDLNRRLTRGPLDPWHAVDLLSQVAIALDAAHTNGVLHRDVKPANILLDTDGTAYLADFGIARSFTPDATMLSSTGEQIGTLDYMAPERLTNTAGCTEITVGIAADVYSLACVLFQCLTGQVPFPVSHPEGKLAAQLNDPPPAPSLFDNRIPAALDLVVRTGMDKDPRRRYPTAGELMAAAAAVTSEPTVILPDLPAPAGNYFAKLVVHVAAERTTPWYGGGEADRCPYPGLQSFEVGDRGWFFGRERVVSELLARLSRQHSGSGPLIVVGASGAGKSSLLSAGLLAAHTRNGVPAPRIALTPGEHPIDTLAARLAGLTRFDAGRLAWRLRDRPAEFGELCQPAMKQPDAPLMIVVDQFEELFTQCADEQERTAFATALANAWPARVVLAVRADFVEHCIMLAPLREPLAAPYILPPLSNADLVRVITEPASVCGLELEAGLAERLIADAGARDGAGGDPGALPRLAHALRETWHNRSGNLLTLKGYQQTGGVDRAVALTADGVYHRLSDADRTTLRTALPRLVTLLEDGGIVRRRAARGVLPQHILESLIAARLVTVDRDTVTLAHDALLTAWPRLRQWVAEDREGLLVRQRLGVAAEAWRAGGRDRGDLYRGARLAAAVDWANDRSDLTPVEQEFLRASERDRRRASRRLRGVLVGLATLLVVALVAGVMAVLARNDAEQGRLIAESRRLAAESLAQSDVDPVGAMKKALEAWRTAETTEARGALLSAPLFNYPAAFDAGVDVAASVAASPDGSWIAVGGRGKLVLWDMDEREPRVLAEGDPEGVVIAVAFSPDGKYLASSTVGSADGDEDYVRVWAIPSGRLVATPAKEVEAFGQLAWRPDSQVLAAVSVRADASFAIGAWDLRGTWLGWIADAGPNVTSIAYGPDGDRLAMGFGDGRLELWDPTTATLINRRTDHGDNSNHTFPKDLAPVDVTYSRDLLASASPVDNLIRLWDPTTGAPVRQIRDVTRHSSTPGGGPGYLAFTPDGATLISNSDEGTITAWDPVDAKLLRRFPQGRRESTAGGPAVLSLAVSADGRTTVAGTANGTVLRWRANQSWYLELRGAVTGLDFSPNGTIVSAGDAEGEVHTWNPFTGEQVGSPVDLGRSVFALQYTEHGVRIAGTDGATFTATPTGPGVSKQRTITLDGRAFRGAMAVSPNGDWFAAAHQLPTSNRAYDNQITIWRMADFTKQAVLNVGDQWPFALAFSPNSGQLVAITSLVSAGQDVAGASMLTWRAPEFANRKMVQLTEDATLYSAAFRDDRTLLTGGANGKIQVRDAATGRLRDEFGEHPSTIRRLALSPDGRKVATVTSEDLTVRLWDISEENLVANLTGPVGPLNKVEFGANGKLLAAGGTDTDVAVWYTDPAAAIRLVCANLADAGERNLHKIGCS